MDLLEQALGEALGGYGWLLALLAGLAVLVVLARSLARPSQVPVPYVAQALLTATEEPFFQALREAVGADFHILCKVRLADLVKVEPGCPEYTAAFNRIAKKHVDFVLCDGEALAVCAVVELDDRSHERADRQARDVFVDRVFEAAGIPIFHLPAADAYDPAALRALLLGTP